VKPTQASHRVEVLASPRSNPPIEGQILSSGIAQGPQIPHRVTAQKRLREVPHFPRQRILVREGMRNRERLAKLSSTHSVVSQFIDKGIRVVVESLQVCAREDKLRIPCTPTNTSPRGTSGTLDAAELRVEEPSGATQEGMFLNSAALPSGLRLCSVPVRNGTSTGSGSIKIPPWVFVSTFYF